MPLISPPEYLLRLKSLYQNISTNTENTTENTNEASCLGKIDSQKPSPLNSKHLFHIKRCWATRSSQHSAKRKYPFKITRARDKNKFYPRELARAAGCSRHSNGLQLYSRPKAIPVHKTSSRFWRVCIPFACSSQTDNQTAHPLALNHRRSSNRGSRIPKRFPPRGCRLNAAVSQKRTPAHGGTRFLFRWFYLSRGTHARR